MACLTGSVLSIRGGAPSARYRILSRTCTRYENIIIDRLQETVVPVILDGENAWEYFPNDGHQFLTQFYTALQEDPFIETITMTEAAPYFARQTVALDLRRLLDQS